MATPAPTAGLAAENTSAIEGLGAGHIVFQDTVNDPSFDQSRINPEQVRRWDATSGVVAAAVLGVSRATIGLDDSIVPVVVFGAEAGSFIAPPALSAGTVVIPRQLADDEELSVGDRLSIGSVGYTVAITPGDASYAHSPVVWLSLTEWQQLNGSGVHATVIALDAGDIGNQNAVEGTVVVPANQSLQAIGSFAEENGSLQLMRGFLLVISALVVGAFFTVWTIQRRHDVAVLKAMGASTRYLLGDAIGQATVMLAGAAAVGGGLGFVIGRLVSGTVPFVSDATTTLFPLATMAAIGLIGAALAVRSIVSVDPLTALGAGK